MSNDSLTISISSFAKMTGCSRNLAYQLARNDKLPIPVIFLGEKRMCVSKKAVEKLLNGEADTSNYGSK
jgi:hypothetical protein